MPSGLWQGSMMPPVRGVAGTMPIVQEEDEWVDPSIFVDVPEVGKQPMRTSVHSLTQPAFQMSAAPMRFDERAISPVRKVIISDRVVTFTPTEVECASLTPSLSFTSIGEKPPPIRTPSATPPASHRDGSGSGGSPQRHPTLPELQGMLSGQEDAIQSVASLCQTIDTKLAVTDDVITGMNTHLTEQIEGALQRLNDNDTTALEEAVDGVTARTTRLEEAVHTISTHTQRNTAEAESLELRFCEAESRCNTIEEAVQAMTGLHSQSEVAHHRGNNLESRLVETEVRQANMEEVMQTNLAHSEQQAVEVAQFCRELEARLAQSGVRQTAVEEAIQANTASSQQQAAEVAQFCNDFESKLVETEARQTAVEETTQANAVRSQQQAAEVAQFCNDLGLRLSDAETRRTALEERVQRVAIHAQETGDTCNDLGQRLSDTETRRIALEERVQRVAIHAQETGDTCNNLGQRLGEMEEAFTSMDKQTEQSGHTAGQVAERVSGLESAVHGLGVKVQETDEKAAGVGELCNGALLRCEAVEGALEGLHRKIDKCSPTVLDDRVAELEVAVKGMAYPVDSSLSEDLLQALQRSVDEVAARVVRSGQELAGVNGKLQTVEAAQRGFLARKAFEERLRDVLHAQQNADERQSRLVERLAQLEQRESRRPSLPTTPTTPVRDDSQYLGLFDDIGLRITAMERKSTRLRSGHHTLLVSLLLQNASALSRRAVWRQWRKWAARHRTSKALAKRSQRTFLTSPFNAFKANVARKKASKVHGRRVRMLQFIESKAKTSLMLRYLGALSRYRVQRSAKRKLLVRHVASLHSRSLAAHRRRVYTKFVLFLNTRRAAVKPPRPSPLALRLLPALTTRSRAALAHRYFSKLLARRHAAKKKRAVVKAVACLAAKNKSLFLLRVYGKWANFRCARRQAAVTYHFESSAKATKAKRNMLNAVVYLEKTNLKRFVATWWNRLRTHAALKRSDKNLDNALAKAHGMWIHDSASPRLSTLEAHLSSLATHIPNHVTRLNKLEGQLKVLLSEDESGLEAHLADLRGRCEAHNESIEAISALLSGIKEDVVQHSTDAEKLKEEKAEPPIANTVIIDDVLVRVTALFEYVTERCLLLDTAVLQASQKTTKELSVRIEKPKSPVSTVIAMSTSKSPREAAVKSPREFVVRSPIEVNLTREVNVTRSPREIINTRSPREIITTRSPREIIATRSPREVRTSPWRKRLAMISPLKGRPTSLGLSTRMTSALRAVSPLNIGVLNRNRSPHMSPRRARGLPGGILPISPVGAESVRVSPRRSFGDVLKSSKHVSPPRGRDELDTVQQLRLRQKSRSEAFENVLLRSAHR